ncbi:MAG: amidohydrolase family protein [Thermomicrobiales bacterium]
MTTPDRAILGARIRTLDPHQPVATALAMQDGAITAIGDDAAIRRVCDGTTELIDGTGMTIVPGLTDTHLHPFWGAEATQGLDLQNVTTLGELNAVLAAEWERKQGEGWITGWGVCTSNRSWRRAFAATPLLMLSAPPHLSWFFRCAHRGGESGSAGTGRYRRPPPIRRVRFDCLRRGWSADR